MSAVMTEVKDKEERRLRKVKIALMRNPMFVELSGVMMVGKTEVRDDVPTAYTNGRDEVYGRDMLKWMSEKEIGFVIMHEVMHKAYRHMSTWRKLWEQDPQLANMACDYVINLMLVDTDPNESMIAMPKKDGKLFGLLDRKYAGMNAKQVFDLLKQNGESNNVSSGFDEHGWDDAEGMPEEAKKELEKEIDRALRQGQIAAQKVGKGKGGMSRAIGDLLKPKVDWKEVMREFVSSICANKDTSSWRRVNRRFVGNGVYMPSLIGERVGRIVVAVDTSGSIGGVILDRFLSEVKALADSVHPEAIDLLYWGSSVEGHEVYDDANMSSLLDSTKPVDGGGTHPPCVPAYMKDKELKPECVVVLTDGYVDSWGTWDMPVLWVVVGNSGAVSPVGKTVNVEEM